MKDLTGKVFNSWTVLEEGPRDIYGKRTWISKCKCGSIKVIAQGNLESLRTRMCRPCSLEARKLPEKMEDHRLYLTWKSMHSRCNNPNTASYKNYGSRGIKVCERWRSFYLFLEDMYPSYKEGLTLDRVDVDRGYSKDNCRWATVEEQSNNKRDSIKIEYKGKVYTEAQLDRAFNIKRTTMQRRRRAGWTVEELIFGKSNLESIRNITYQGKTYKSLKDIAEDFGIEAGTFRYRIRKGWPLQNAITGENETT